MSVISERAIGAMPVSIATAIALQKLAGMKRARTGAGPIPTTVPLGLIINFGSICVR